MTRLDFIPPQFVKVTQATRPDLAQYVVAGVHIDEGKPGVARAWKVNADGSDGGEIEFVNEGGKDDTVDVAILPDGGVRLVVSEALPPSGSGSTAQPVVYLISDVFPPAPSLVAGSAYVTAPGGAITALNAAPFAGSTFLNLAALGVPHEATLVNLQVQVVAPQANRRALVGVAGPHTWQLVAAVQSAGVELTTCALVTPNASHAITVAADAGDLARLEVYILGWFY